MAATVNTFNLVSQTLKKSHRFTVQDISTQTGLSTYDAGKAIEELMEVYYCKLQVTEQGDLVYDFGTKLKRRNAVSLKEIVYKFAIATWKVFTFLFKIWIMLMLIGYFVAFVALLIGLAVASSGRSNNNKNSGIGGGAIQLLIRVFMEFFYWRTVTNTFHYRTDRYGYKYREYDSENSKILGARKKKNKKKFIVSVFDFVFGPKRAEIHPLENQREVASFIRKNKGILTLSEVRALAGWKGEKADNFFTECSTRFEGDIKVSDNGTIYSDFKDFLSSKADLEGTDIIFYWDEFEPEYKLTGNTTGRNLLIFVMNAFVLGMSLGVLNGNFDQFLYEFQFNHVLWMGWVPFIYSFLFFAVPLVRMLVYIPLRKRRRLHNIRKRLMKAIYFEKNSDIPLKNLEDIVNSSDSEMEKVSKGLIEKLLDDEVHDWEGELHVDEEGNPVYNFEILKTSQKDAAKLRQERQRVAGDDNKIVFDSGMS